MVVATATRAGRMTRSRRRYPRRTSSTISPSGRSGARDVGDGLVLARVERATGRCVDGGHALALEQRPQLAVDGGDALEPGVVGDRRRPGLDGPIEVVGDGQHLADEVLAGQAEIAHPLLGRPALEVLELRALALERHEVLLGHAGGLVALGRQGLDLADQRGRRDVDVVGALLRTGAAPLRHRGDPPIHSSGRRRSARCRSPGNTTSVSARGRRPRRSPGPGGRTAPGRARRRACRAAGSRDR